MKEKIRKFLAIVFLLIFIISITYIIVYFYTTYKNETNLKELQSIMNTIRVVENKNIASENEPQNVNSYEVNQEKNNNAKIENFKELKKLYSNIVAWIEIENTTINYPIMQSNDNDYYLYRNYKNEYSRYGSIFLDYKYDFSKDSQNFLIYGHNNNDEMMFNELLKYQEKEYFEAHPSINLITENDITNYKIVSVFKSQVYSQDATNVFKYYNYVDLSNEDTFTNYITNVKKASIYDIDIEPQLGDDIITLSTCEYSKPNGRFVIVGISENNSKTLENK